METVLVLVGPQIKTNEFKNAFVKWVSEGAERVGTQRPRRPQCLAFTACDRAPAAAGGREAGRGVPVCGKAPVGNVLGKEPAGGNTR